MGNIEGYCNRHSVHRTVSAGYGADRPVTYIDGSASAGFDFGDILAPTHTVCSVTRYTGSHRKRILTSAKTYNWLHGHWSNNAGVAYYQGWLTPDNRYKNTRDWVVLCGTNGANRAYDAMSADSTVNIGTEGKQSQFSETIPMLVNHGRGGVYDERSDFGVMEVITWDRVLSEDEMLASLEYLKWKLRAGAVLEVSEHLATESQSNFDAWGVQDLDGQQSKTFEVDLANGYKAELSGWAHTRYYARGFLRNLNGKATAVVKGLTPAAQYIYQLYMVHELPNWQGEGEISVNHGVEARTIQNHMSEAYFSGVAAATPRGEINFEMERIAPHFDLSGIAVAGLTTSASLLEEAASYRCSVASVLQGRVALVAVLSPTWSDERTV